MQSATLPNGLVRATDRLLMIAGSYGSGKTEVSVNLALALARAGRRVQIADLDIVNPYFRCREARQLMEAHGIRVVVPAGAQAWADLPIILPEIQGMIAPPEGTLSLFDVGGDDAGSRALAAFRPLMVEGRYEFWQVINSRRPFTGSVAGCLEMRRAIEHSSRLKLTGLLVNSHLIEQTTPAVILEGWLLAREVARVSGLPLRAVAAMGELAELPELSAIDVPLLRLERHMLPPWIAARAQADGAPADAASGDGLPAPRPVPLGRRTPTGTAGA